MTAELTPFFYDDGAEVRTMLIDGEPMFVASDIARALGYRNAPDMTRSLDEDEKGYAEVRTPGGPQTMTILTEAGVYQCIFGSRARDVQPFKRWIAHDVIPQIRRTGSYAAPAPISREQQLAQAVVVAQQVIDEQAARVRELEPKADYVDQFVAAEDLRLLRNVAKSLGINEHELRHALLEHHWIYQEVQERWSNRRGEKVRDYRYSPYADKTSCFRPVPAHDAPRFRGEVMHTLKVTPAGAQAIARAAREWGLTGHLEAQR